MEDVLRLLEQAAEDLGGLENSVSRARAFVALSGAALKALEVGEIEDRIKALEEAINGSRGAA